MIHFILHFSSIEYELNLILHNAVKRYIKYIKMKHAVIQK